MEKGQDTSRDAPRRVILRGRLQGGAVIAAPLGPIPMAWGLRVPLPSRPSFSYARVQASPSVQRMVTSGIRITNPQSSSIGCSQRGSTESKETCNRNTRSDDGTEHPVVHRGG